MRRLSLLLLILFLVPVTLSSQSTAAIDASQIFKNAKDSVVILATTDSAGNPKSIGSGFFVGNGARIVTNLHVLEGAAKVFAKNAAGDVIEITHVAGIDAEMDLAILVSPVSRNPLPLASTAPEIGSDVLAIGNPQGLEATISTGIISGIRNDKGKQYYQITAPISPGSSGGPILSEMGEVVGVASFYVLGGQNLNFAVPAAYVIRLLRNEKLATIQSVNKIPSQPKKEPKTTSVRLIDEKLRCSWNPCSSIIILEGYIQNLSRFPVMNVKISISYFKGSSVPKNNRGNDHCWLFTFKYVQPGTAEPFECVFKKYRKDLRAIYRLEDYKFKR